MSTLLRPRKISANAHGKGGQGHHNFAQRQIKGEPSAPTKEAPHHVPVFTHMCDMCVALSHLAINFGRRYYLSAKQQYLT